MISEPQVTDHKLLVKESRVDFQNVTSISNASN